MIMSFWIGLVLVLIFGIDIICFFIFGLSRLPTSFTEWWCYPLYASVFYPVVKKGFSMRIASNIRILEFIGIITGIILIMLK